VTLLTDTYSLQADGNYCGLAFHYAGRVAKTLELARHASGCVNSLSNDKDDGKVSECVPSERLAMTDSASKNEPWLHNGWYQAAWSHELKNVPLIARTILNQPLIVFRDGSGSLCTLHDRCPHRFAPLSAGMITDGVVRCGYHGLAFDGRGRCVDNPHGGISSAMHVRAYPALERHGAVWVWMGQGEADESLLPTLRFIDETPDTARQFGYMETAANYQLLTDNILDLSHADYLHPDSLGGMMTGSKVSTKEEGGEFRIQWESSDCQPPPAYRSIVPPPARADIWTEVRWRAPAIMILSTGANVAGAARNPVNEAVTLHNMTPATLTSSHYFFCATRKFKVEDAEFNRMIGEIISNAFRNEDKPMLEKQQASMGEADFWSLKPVLLSIDTGSVQVRRLLAKMIDAERGCARAPSSASH
jgi:phenylpropionate dioxygenase-like ring-hydroxylating dioxygenase large terminal subunit